MKNNYPIIYAAIPMIEQIGWGHGMHELEREYGPVCYIVSKCYLVSKTEKYNEDGSLEKKYEVVCPYEYDSDARIWKRKEPSFNLIHGGCTNAIVTDEVYDNFIEAEEAKKRKNQEILDSKYGRLKFDKSFNEKVNEIKKEFKEKLRYYEQIEKFNKKDTILKINSAPKKQTTIMYIPDKYDDAKVYDYSLYYLIDLFDNYEVYSVTQGEYQIMQHLSSEDIDFRKYQHTPLLRKNKGGKIIKIISPSNKKEYIEKGKIVTEDISFEDQESYKNKIYTTETYEDIINSYPNNERNNALKLVRK